MAVLFRWLIRLATAFVVLITCAVALVYYFASRSLPDYSDTFEVAGIAAPVEIVRDNANVPHIFGASDEDVFFALGLAHAQDRLWQMTMLRRTSQGRLSELFGARTLPIDSLIRRLDLHPLSQQSVRALDAETQAALRAYSAGVNAWIGQVNEGARGRGAPEMWLFNHAIAPWQPADSIAIVKLMALQLTGHLQEEVLRARTSLILNDDQRLRDIMPDVPGAGHAALPEYASLVPGLTSDDAFGLQLAQLPLSEDPLSPVRPRGLSGASNAWRRRCRALPRDRRSWRMTRIWV